MASSRLVRRDPKSIFRSPSSSGLQVEGQVTQVAQRSSTLVVYQEMRRVFDETIANHLRPNATEQNFPPEDLTPNYGFHDDDHDLDPDHGDLEVTPELGDNYLNKEISVPQGGTLMNGHVTSWKRDKDGIPVGLANANPILDMREYTFTFNDGDETVLNANLIAEAMYA
jgi:hypothetical protein